MPHPAVRRAREVEWFDAQQRVTAASHSLMWALRDLAKVERDVAMSATRHLARELRKAGLDDDFCNRMLALPDAEERAGDLP